MQCLLVLLLAGFHAFGVRAADESDATAQKAGAMAARAIAYLRSVQDPATGSWGRPADGPGHPAITGLVLQGFLKEPGVTDTDPAVAAGVKYLLQTQRPDGGFYEALLPSYNTAIALSGLAGVRNPAGVGEAREHAVEFLKRLQYGEGAKVFEGMKETATNVTGEHAYYGGWGYGNRGRPDLSNTAFAVEALRNAGVPEDDPAFERALVFLQRCQMRGESNDMAYARGSTQGGFVYSTSVNKDRIGAGQSFAGEVVESLTGADEPGTEAVFAFRRGPDGKRLVMTKEQVIERCRSTLLEDRCLVALGSTGDGLSGSIYRVRCALREPEALASIVREAFARELDEESLKASTVGAWRGESRLASYGTMTYSGFKSYLYAGLSKDDPRVRAALGWMSEHYTLEENPGLGREGLYYYYVVFAKAHRALGRETMLVDGVERSWRADLVLALEKLQQPDGSFRSVADRWMENDRVLITAYALVALQEAR